MMSAVNSGDDRFICLSGGCYIKIDLLLMIFSEAIRQSQKKIDKRHLYLARKLLSSTQPRFLRQLLGLFIFHRYKITELNIEFAVNEKMSSSVLGEPTRYHLVCGPMEYEHVRLASVKVSEGDQTLAEFRIDGELISSVIGERNETNIC